MMTMKQRYYITTSWLAAIFATLLAGSVQAQIFPVTANMQLTPPHSVYLSDYVAPGSMAINTTLVFNDLNESSIEVGLRVRIEGPNVTLSTREDYRPMVPITLLPAVPETLSGDALMEYMAIENLDIVGMSAAELQQGARLPEGFYRFCIEVYEINSGVAISQQACQSAFLSLQDEPIPLTPLCEQVIDPQEPQSILFQWQASNAPSPVSGSMPEYVLTLYEITNPDVNPLQAVQSRQALQIFESEPLMATTFFYDVSAPPLELGKRYVWQVRVEDPEGKQQYKNDGKSQFCSFQYGYPITYDGQIPLMLPEKDLTVDRERPLRLRWDVPSNVNEKQQVSYALKIVEVEEEQEPEAAIESNEAWHEETTPPTNPRYAWDAEVRKEIKADKVFAWQVRAFIGEEEVAKSEVYTFNSGAAMNEFRAGKHVVVLTEITESDPNNFAGTGKFKISEEDDSVEVDFSGIKLKQAGTKWTLLEGELTAKYEGEPIELQPENDLNGAASFFIDNFVLNKDGLSLQGQVRLPLPHPVTSGDTDSLRSAKMLVDFNEYKVKGSARLSEGNSFDLLDPLGFTIELDTTSDFAITEGKYKLRLNGKILLPEKVKGFEDDQARVAIPFQLAEQLYTFTKTDQLPITNNIAPIPGTGLKLVPKKVEIDFSEESSPGYQSSSSDWKGAYFEEFEIVFTNNGESFDGTNQLNISQEISQVFTINSIATIAWTDGQGLQLEASESFSEGKDLKFNTFTGTMDEFSIKIENNEVVKDDSRIVGAISIPFLSEDMTYPYEIPVGITQLEEGYLEQGLSEYGHTFNSGDYDQEIYVTIKRAVFKENAYLEAEVDLNWPRLDGATAEGVTGFRIWGDNSIGFNTKNGIHHFSKQVEGKLDDFDVAIQTIKAGYARGSYGIFTEMTIDVGDDLSGEDGPVVTAIRSVQPANLPEGNTPDPSVAEEGMGAELVRVTAAREGGDEEDAEADPISPIKPKHSTPFLDFSVPTMRYIEDDPTWGSSFHGAVDAQLHIPTEMYLRGIIVAGKKDDFSYWFIEIGGGAGERMGGNEDDMTPPEEEEEEEEDIVALDEELGFEAMEETDLEGDYDEEIEEMEGAIENYEKSIAKIEAQKAKEEEEANRLKQSSEQATAALSAKESTLRAKEAEYERLRTTANQDKINRSRDVVAAARRVYETSPSAENLRVLRQKEQTLRKQQDDAQQMIRRAKADVDRVKSERNAARIKKQQAENQYKRADSKLRNTEQKLSKRQKAVEKAKKRKKVAEDAKDEYEKKQKEEEAEEGKKKKKDDEEEDANKEEVAKMEKPADMGGFSITGAEGRIYRHMSRTDAGRVSEGTSGEFAYEPNGDAPFGFYLRIQGEKKSAAMETQFFGALEFTKLSGGAMVGIEVGMEMEASGGNSGNFILGGTYNSTKKELAIQGSGEFEGGICAEGYVGLYSGPPGFVLDIGKEDSRITIGPCVGFAGTGWFHLSTIEKEIEVGVGVAFRAKISSPWIPSAGSNNRIRGRFEASAAFLAVGKFGYSPFEVKRIGLIAELKASANLDYRVKIRRFSKSGSFEVASITLTGKAFVYFNPDKVEGSLSGEVRVLSLVTVRIPELKVSHNL